MNIYLYTIPDEETQHTNIPVYDEDRQTAFVLRRSPHRLLNSVLQHMTKAGIPYCYMAVSPDDRPIFKIDCPFSGVGYTIQSMHSQKKNKIEQYHVQLVEKVQTFRLQGDDFHFEKDYTGAGLLTRNDEKIAKIERVDSMHVNTAKRIRIEAREDMSASLIAVLYQTFIEKQ